MTGSDSELPGETQSTADVGGAADTAAAGNLTSLKSLFHVSSGVFLLIVWE